MRCCRHAARRFCPPPRSYRLFALRRCDPDQGAGRPLQDRTHAGGRDHRQRQPVRRARIRDDLQRRGRAGPGLIGLAYRHGLLLVATNDVYFPDRDCYEAHDALLCIAQGTVVADADRKRLTRSHYFRPAAEMREVFADLPEACDNTLVIAQRCAFIPQPRQPILPAFATDADSDEETALRHAAAAGLDARLTALGLKDEESVEPYRDRLDFELDTIIGMGFAGYFLIVADFIQWAKREGIQIGRAH